MRLGLPLLLGSLLALTACGTDDVAITPPAPTGAVATACRDLVATLPRDIDADLRARTVTPSSPYTRAWGSPAATLRCGLPTPAAATVKDTEQLQIGHVCWGSPDVTADTIEWHPRGGASPYVVMDLPPSVSAANALAPASDHMTASTCTDT